jgi:hypothetical protein
MAMERASLRRAIGGYRGLFGPEQALVLLRAAWPGAVGKDVARRTEVVALERGVLRIRVPDARWRNVLHKMRGPILSRLTAVAGDLAPRQLGFLETATPGPVAASETEEGPSASAAEIQQAPTPPLAVAQAAEAISDPDLRARFLASAALYLDRARSAGR